MTSDYSPPTLWPVLWPCDVTTESPTITGAAVGFASDVLWALTGQRFGFTTVTLRPCRQYALDTPFPDGWLSWPGTQPPPLGANGSGGWYGWWFLAGCSSCRESCGCGTISELMLPAPVHAVTEVKVDGVVITGSGYRLYDRRRLVRVGATWPNLNNLTKDDTEVGTWSITAQYGESVPTNAALAIGELACEYVRGATGQDCRLPRGVTQLARQGVTITLPDVSTMFEKGLTGLFFVDMFIKTWNPNNLKHRPRTYSVDQPLPRRPT